MGVPSRLRSHRIHLRREKLSFGTTEADERRHLNPGKDERNSPLDNWIVDAWGSIPARMPRYRTSEWEIKEIGFLQNEGVEEELRQSLHAPLQI